MHRTFVRRWLFENYFWIKNFKAFRQRGRDSEIAVSIDIVMLRTILGSLMELANSIVFFAQSQFSDSSKHSGKIATKGSNKSSVRNINSWKNLTKIRRGSSIAVWILLPLSLSHRTSTKATSLPLGTAQNIQTITIRKILSGHLYWNPNC